MEQTDLSRQNEMVISLLGRLAFPEAELKKIITRKKQNPLAYVRGYNACDGEKGVTEVAKIVGVSQPTMTTILQSWRKIGIIYQKGKNPIKLYNLKEDKEDGKQDENNTNGAGKTNGENSQAIGLVDNSEAAGSSEEQ